MGSAMSNGLHYYIIGTDHILQEPSPDTPLDKVAAYEAMLAAVIRRDSPVLIAEEINVNRPDDQQKAIGRKLAGSSVHWISIDMPLPEQRERDIVDDLDHAAILRASGRNVYYVRANSIRENYWLTQIQKACQRLEILCGVVLITCGRNHAEFLAEKALLSGVASSVYIAEYPPNIKQMSPPLELCLQRNL